MSQENMEVVRHFYACWTNRDFDGVLRCADPDVRFDWSESQSPYGGVYVGHQGVMEFRNDLEDAFDDFSVEAVDVTEVGPECLVAETVVRGRGKESGIVLQATGAMLWSLRAGKIVSGKLFQHREEALKAAGLGDPPAPCRG